MQKNGSAAIKGNKPNDIKNNNQQAVVQLLYHHKELTIPEIAEHLSLSRTAATKITKELADQDLLVESGKRDSCSSGGRRPSLFTINKDYKYVIAILLYPQEFYCTLVDMGYNLRLKIRQSFTENEQLENTAMINTLAAAIHQVMDEMKLHADQLCGITIMVKGVVNLQTGTVVFPIGASWKAGMPLRDDLAKTLNFEANIIVENDSRCVGCAELISFPERHEELLMVIVSSSYGVGGCVLDRGSLLHGANYFAGEIGHMTVEPFSERLCDCGSYGCLEVLINTKAVLDYAAEYAPLYPESALVKAALDRSLSEAEIFEAANMGEALACKVIDRVAIYLAVGIHNVMITLNPHRIILEGRLRLMGEYFLDKLQNELTIFPKYIANKLTEVLFSSYQGEEGELMAHMQGASYYTLKQYFTKRWAD